MKAVSNCKYQRAEVRPADLTFWKKKLDHKIKIEKWMPLKENFMPIGTCILKIVTTRSGQGASAKTQNTIKCSWSFKNSSFIFQKFIFQKFKNQKFHKTEKQQFIFQKNKKPRLSKTWVWPTCWNMHALCWNASWCFFWLWHPTQHCFIAAACHMLFASSEFRGQEDCYFAIWCGAIHNWVQNIFRTDEDLVF